MVRLKRLAPALACTLILCATGAIAQTNSAHRSADVVAGKSHRLGVYGNVQKDCTSGPLPTVRVLTPPKHGELNVRSGTDEVSYEVKSASGKVESHTVRITVKDAPPVDAKPNPDADPDL